MGEEDRVIELVRLAQRGQADAKEGLAREAERRVRAFIYRAVLEQDLTEELTQQTLLEMVDHLESLNSIEHFWGWLYGIAQNKIQQHYRYKQRKAAISASVFYEDFLSQQVEPQDDAFRQLLKKELSKTVMSAMKEIKQKYRAVLSLRCFDDLPFTDIALAMHCSEIKARVMFVRAKQALKKELNQHGVSKTLMVMCLGLFGKLTAKTQGAPLPVPVVPASIKAGLGTIVIGAVTTKLGLATIATVAAVLAVVGGFSIVSSEPALPKRGKVGSYHYTVQLPSDSSNSSSSLSGGSYEKWFFLPEEADGPVFMKMQRWEAEQNRKLCTWLENDKGNYYYDPSEQKVYVTNYHLWMPELRVWRLPTDTAEFTSFLSRVEGDIKGVKYTRDSTSGLLLKAVDRRFLNAPLFETKYEYNCCSIQDFCYDWPDSAAVADQRDKMHKRGWTYFGITGQINGQSVIGRGRISFVYRTFKQNPPWLELNVGDRLKIIDCSDTVDVVRRDAVKSRIRFDTTLADSGQDAIVSVLENGGNSNVELIYKIDLINDIIKDIRFKVDNRSAGSLVFSHLQDIADVDVNFIEPTLPDYSQRPQQKGPGMMWLIYLAQGKLRG